jgi:cellulose synthase/poly-beta-1,6-N-acetylglucosamine synthase-like glycosyltransferase
MGFVVTLFWTCCALLAYVYVLYPALVAAFASRYGKPVRRGDGLPTVTIVVTVFNEQDCIRAKLDNLADLDYPSELVNVVVASDASSDATEAIAASCDRLRIRVLRLEGRQGKTACQNAAAAAATGEILIFTDATTRLHANALRRLVENFADAAVGCVAGRLDYIADLDNLTGCGGRAYWSYELRLRANESLLGSLIGVSGCLYAVRRSAYRAIHPHFISDFVIAMTMREQGLRTVLAPEAVCFEATLDQGRQELAMRVRVAIRSLNALIGERRFLNPVKYGCFAWQLWSHKVLRYATPLLWIAALAANVALASQAPYLLLLLGQLALLAAGSVGFILRGAHRNLGFFSQPYYFLLTNIASLVATLRYLQGERMVTWNPIRNGSPIAGA